MGFTYMHQLPSFESSDAKFKPLLAVILTYLDEAGKTQLVSHFHKTFGDSTEIQIWTPSKPFLASITKQSSYHDSQANIHALAVLAYRAGWPGFMIADGLTKRQLIGTRRLGESPGISLVITAVGLVSPAERQKNEALRVVCRRTGGQKMDHTTLLETTAKLEPKTTYFTKEESVEHVYVENGIVLHDPDRSILTADTAKSLVREEHINALTMPLSEGHKTLPMELVVDIISKADATEPIKLPLWEHPHDTKHLLLFLFYHATAEELIKTQSAIEELIQKEGMSVELIPLERHHISSRRELITFWEGYRDKGLIKGRTIVPLNIVLEPIHDIDSAQFATVYLHRDSDLPALAFHTTLSKIVVETRQSGDDPVGAKGLAQTTDTGDTEILYPPDQPFYFNPPPWLPASLEIDTSYVSLPAFYLTNRLTDEVDKAVRAEIEEEAESDVDEKGCCYVPWKGGNGQADGTLEDVWDIAWKIYMFEAGDYCEQFICIDQQSGVDKTVILVQADNYYGDIENVMNKEGLRDIPHPDTIGFLYTRIPGRESHSAAINLSIANMNIDEFSADGEEVKRYMRPEWATYSFLLDDDYNGMPGGG